MKFKELVLAITLCSSLLACQKMKINSDVNQSSETATAEFDGVAKYDTTDSQTFFESDLNIGGWAISAGLVDDNFDPAGGFDVNREPEGAARRFCWMKGFDEVDASRVQTRFISAPENPRAGVPNNTAVSFYRKSSRTEPLYALMGQKTPYGQGRFLALSSVTCIGRMASAPELNIQLFDGRNARIDLTRNNWMNVGMVTSGYTENANNALYTSDTRYSTGEINTEGTRVWGSARSFCAAKGYDDALGTTQRPIYDFEVRCVEYFQKWVCYQDSSGGRYCQWEDDYSRCRRSEARESSLAFIKNSNDPKLRRSQIRYSSPGEHIFHSITCYKKTENKPNVGQVEIMNGASFVANAIAKESLVTIKAQNLTIRPAAQASQPYPFTLAGVQVLVNGRPSPLTYVSNSQINFILPGALAENKSYGVEVISEGKRIAFTNVFVKSSAPGIFTIDSSGSGYATGQYQVEGTEEKLLLANNEGQAVEVPVSASGARTALVFYGTGLKFSAVHTTQVLVDGILADVFHVGAHSDFPGMDQINFFIPSEVAGKSEVEVVVISESGMNSAPVKVKLKALNKSDE
jgi:uncharacterized protein (TIGR03437 family)